MTESSSTMMRNPMETPPSVPLQTSKKGSEQAERTSPTPSDSSKDESGRSFVHFSADTKHSPPPHRAAESLPKRRHSVQYVGGYYNNSTASTTPATAAPPGYREPYHHPHHHHAIGASSVATAATATSSPGMGGSALPQQRYHRSRSISHPYTPQTAPALASARYTADVGDISELRPSAPAPSAPTASSSASSTAAVAPGSTSPEYKTQWIFWYAAGAKKPAGGLSREDYMNALIREGSFNQPADVMEVCDRVFHATDAAAYRTFHLFKKGIKPVWEDPRNAAGGKWILTCPSGMMSGTPGYGGPGGRRHSIASAAASSEAGGSLGHARALDWWKTLILAMMAGRLGYKKQICGVMLSLQPWGGAVISLWNSNASDAKQIAAIKAKLKRLLARQAAAVGLTGAAGAELNIKYQAHHPGGAAAVPNMAGGVTTTAGAEGESEVGTAVPRRLRSKSDPWPLLSTAARRASTGAPPGIDADRWVSRAAAGPAAAAAAEATKAAGPAASELPGGRRSSFSKRLEVFENIASEEEDKEEEEEEEEDSEEEAASTEQRKGKEKKKNKAAVHKDVMVEGAMDKTKGATTAPQETLAVTSATPPVVTSFFPVMLGKALAGATRPPTAPGETDSSIKGNGSASLPMEKEQVDSLRSENNWLTPSPLPSSTQTLSSPGGVRGGGGSAQTELVSREEPHPQAERSPLEPRRPVPSGPPGEREVAEEAEEKAPKAAAEGTRIDGSRGGWMPLTDDYPTHRIGGTEKSKRFLAALLAVSAVVSVCAVTYLAYFGGGGEEQARGAGKHR